MGFAIAEPLLSLESWQKSTNSGCKKVKKYSKTDLFSFMLTTKTVLNKMELLQTQAPVDQELSGSSASARHGTSDIGH